MQDHENNLNKLNLTFDKWNTQKDTWYFHATFKTEDKFDEILSFYPKLERVLGYGDKHYQIDVNELNIMEIKMKRVECHAHIAEKVFEIKDNRSSKYERYFNVTHNNLAEYTLFVAFYKKWDGFKYEDDEIRLFTQNISKRIKKF